MGSRIEGRRGLPRRTQTYYQTSFARARSHRRYASNTLATNHLHNSRFTFVLGEVNVVQVEAMTWKDSVKIPVATLKAGGPNNQVLLDLSFPDPPVTFTLVQGNGPVHVIGHHLIGSPMEEFDEIDEMEGEMMDDEEDEEGAVSCPLRGKCPRKSVVIHL